MFGWLQEVDGAGNARGPLVEHMGVDQRGPHVAVAEEFLDRSDVLSTFRQIGGITWPQASVAEPLGVPEGVAAGRFADPSGHNRAAHRFLHEGGIEVVTPFLP